MTAVIGLILSIHGPVRAEAGEPTVEEVTALCRKIESAMKGGDWSLLTSVIDSKALFERSLEGLKVSMNTRNGLAAGFFRHDPAVQLSRQICTEVGADGSYRLLRVRVKDGKPRALFRLSTTAGLNYHDLHFSRDAGGRVRIPDLYVFLSGEDLSQTLRRIFLPVVSRENRGWFEKMFQKEGVYVRSLPQLQQFQALGNQGRIDEAMKAYGALPRAVREERHILLLRITILTPVLQRDERYMEMYAGTLRTYLRLYPTDANLDLLLLDHHFLREEYDKAYAAVDRLDGKLGGDPYLNLYRGNIRCAQKRYPEGRTFFKMAIARCPEQQEFYYRLLKASLDEKDFATTTWTLQRLRKNLGRNLEDLKAQPLLADYIQSEEYKRWTAFQNRERVRRNF